MSDAVLVLGGSGFIGRALVDALCARGDSVIAASRGAARFNHPAVQTVTGEFRHPEDFRPLLERSRAVVHLATTSTPGTSAAQPLREVETNLHLTACLLHALQEHPDTELLFLSSGGSLYADADEPSAETARVHPRSYHGAGKLAAEAFISAWCDQFAGKAVALRPSNVYGPGQPERAGFGIIPAAFGKILRGEVLHVWGDGSARRDYIYIDDVIRLCLTILSSAMASGLQVVNCASGTSVSLNDLFAEMETVCGRRLQRSYDRSRAVDAACIAMDTSLARGLYGWSAQTDLRTGLGKTWEQFVRAAA
ncbi:NAD-dependent epimerase/dehydratase family protein [Fulvimonas yonginensis]|uniref:NAD-dependent epimerase/dehydratase family protein n=1 Tax=Fulvimonas yonginensis TaxID=1495200 RepID=A0ABU8JEG4_9GAMM